MLSAAHRDARLRERFFGQALCAQQPLAVIDQQRYLIFCKTHPLLRIITCGGGIPTCGGGIPIPPLPVSPYFFDYLPVLCYHKAAVARRVAASMAGEGIDEFLQRNRIILTKE